MSDFLNKYPYTDFHELNLDWVIERVKKLTEDWAATLEEWNSTEEQWQQLYDYVHDYFDNLDVQQEINNKIDQMISDGTFALIATPIIENQVVITTTAWLADHITQPTTPAVDTSLSIAGAAADSKTVGDTFKTTLRSFDHTLTHVNTYGYSDADNFALNSIVSINNDVLATDIANLPAYGNVALMITFNALSNQTYLSLQYYIIIGSPTESYIRTSRYIGGSTVWSAWVKTTEDIHIISLIKQYALHGINTVVQHSNLHGLTDCDNTDNNTTYCIDSDVLLSDVANMPCEGCRRHILYTVNSQDTNKYGAIQYFVSINGLQSFSRTSYYSGGNTVWNSWKPDKNKYSTSITFNSAQTPTGTFLWLEAGHTYGIHAKDFGERLNFYIYGYASEYVMTRNYDFVEFTPTHTGLLFAYNLDGKTGSVDIDIYENEELRNFKAHVEEYTVGPDGDFSEITACFLALARNNFKKIIRISGGEYNIKTEYTNNNIPICPNDVDPVINYMDYNAWVPENSHIIGIGNVVIKWTPDIGDITVNESKSVSPLNVRGTCCIENIEVICKNGRYCIHDDPLNLTQFNNGKHEYKNVRCNKQANDASGYGTSQLIGMGFNKGIRYIFESCKFINDTPGTAFYGHSRYNSSIDTDIDTSPMISVNNCILKNASGHVVRLGNSGTSGHPMDIKTTFRSCYLSGEIRACDESNPNQGTLPNVFDITVLNSSNVSVNILDSNNTFIPDIYTI